MSRKWIKSSERLPELGSLVKVMYIDGTPYSSEKEYCFNVRKFEGIRNDMWLCNGCSVIAWRVPTKKDIDMYWGSEEKE